MEAALALPILSVNVGRPARLGTVNGEPVISAFAKRPVSAPAILLGETNLAGDQQADLSVHGGPDKAVYAYCAGHWPAWRSELGLEAGPGTFGENLTLAGADETAVHIGDVFAWGPARLAVSQPRQPCMKLALSLGRNDIGAAMVKTARSGFYLRVLAGGTVPLRGQALTRCAHDPRAPTVRAVFTAYFDPKTSAKALQAMAATPGLATAWRDGFLQRAKARA